MVRLPFAAVLALGAALATASTFAQSAKQTALPRTADGHPDGPSDSPWFRLEP